MGFNTIDKSVLVVIRSSCDGKPEEEGNEKPLDPEVYKVYSIEQIFEWLWTGKQLAWPLYGLKTSLRNPK